MKKNDVAIIVVVAIFATVFSLLVSKFLFTPDKNRNLEAQVVQPISTDFKKPDERVFNSEALNPTQLIQIGNTSNKNPF